MDKNSNEELMLSIADYPTKAVRLSQEGERYQISVISFRKPSEPVTFSVIISFYELKKIYDLAKTHEDSKEQKG